MTQYSMKAAVRQKTGHGYRKSLFRQGLIPAVVYGKTVGNLPLEVAERDLQNALREGRNTIINLSVLGNGGPYKVMIKEVQYDPIKRVFMHADFQQISMRDKIHTDVPIVLTGEVANGLARLALRELEVSCLPTQVPNQITLDVTGMKPGDAVTVSALRVPKGVKVLTDPDATVVTVLAPEEGPVEEAVQEAPAKEKGIE
ncbi:MAG: 50S ribosomal protein L25 [Peptococcaceae bacterium]|nr:50S ribosomal protein L25 [Peptococcaceae bacterium]